MSHLDPVRPGAQWPTELVPGAADWRKFDENQKKAVSVSGGTWNPTSPITFGGAGLGLLSAPSSLTGGLTTRTGGKIVLTGSEFPVLNSRSRTILLDLLDAPPRLLGAAGDASLTFAYPAGVVPLSGQGFQLLGTIPSRYLHHGSGQLDSVKLIFRVTPSAFTSIPSSVLTPGLPGGGVGCTLTVLPLDNTGVPFSNIPSLPAQKLAAPFSPSNLRAAGNLTVWAAGLNITPSGLSGPEYGATYVVPSSNLSQPYSYFKAVGGAVTAGPEPTWDTTIGNITTDGGGVQWMCIGPVGCMYAPDLPTWVNGGQPQTLTMTLVPGVVGSPATFPQTLDLTQYGYAYVIGPLPAASGITLHSIAFTFTQITTMAFE